jgi:phosphonate transport system ATP-binding protein
MLKFHSVSKRYDDGTQALSEVHLDIPQGQFCVLLGSSGAGKSTLLYMVNGLVTPTTGQVEIGGKALNRANMKSIRRTVGMVHQQFNLTPRLSVAMNVLSGALPFVSYLRAAAMWYPRVLRERACKLLAEVGLSPEHLTRRVSELSGGQMQRVGIARAFMLEPQVLLADEPVASLDPRVSRDIMVLLRDEAKRRGTTVVCSLHQPELAVEFADRIIALKGGTLVFDGTPEQLVAAGLDSIYQNNESKPAPSHPVPHVAPQMLEALA